MEHPSERKETISQFEKLLVGLAGAKVDFAVVGDVAIILNGYHRLTVDLDILVEATPENLRKILGYLAAWGEGWARELTLEDFGPEEGAVRLQKTSISIFLRACRAKPFPTSVRI